MDLKCTLCCETLKIDEISIINNNLTSEKNVEILATFQDIFGNIRLNSTAACNRCILALKSHQEFKKSIFRNNNELRQHPNSSTKASINEFLSAINEGVSTHCLDGILMIVPESKNAHIAGFKFLKSLYSPVVSVDNLMIKIYDDVSDDDDDSDDFEAEKLNPASFHEAQDSSSFRSLDLNSTSIKDPAVLALTANDSSPHAHLSEVFSNSNILTPMDTDESSDMDISGSSGELPIIKLEPNVVIAENEPSSRKENIKNLTASEKEWIASNIQKKKVSRVLTNGKFEAFTCLICKKKCTTKNGASLHVLTFHLRKKLKSFNSKHSFLTSEEFQFMEENCIKKGKGGRCKICNKDYKLFERCKQHMIIDHLHKSPFEFNYEAMRKKLCKKGKLRKGEFQCVICRDNENPMMFDNRTKYMKHLRLHTRVELKIYANEENKELASPEDEKFNHPVIQMKSEPNYF